MKTRQDKDVIDCIGVLYVENDNELFWLIGSGVNYDENQIGQLHDWLYKYSLHWKLNSTVVINRIGAIYTENDIELSWQIKSSANYDENQIG